MRRSRSIVVLAIISVLTLLASVPAAFGAETETYEVTVTNLTSGQPFTPVLAATHKGNDGFFTVGKTAGFGLKEISENGNLAPMIDRITSDDSFANHVVATGASVPPVLPGESVTFTIEGTAPFNFLSWASMLICSNDGFTGVNGLKLPSNVGETVTVSTQAYDAGTEINTELWGDIVPPCAPLTGQDNMGMGTGVSNPALAEGGVIHHHRGIIGIGDLDPSINDWTNPVARISVERTG